MRFAVVGAGAIGGYFGARLAEAGEDVVFIARGAHLDALRKRGLRVDSINGDIVLPDVRVSDTPASVGTVEIVLVCVKTWQVPAAAETIRPLVGERTAVLPLQNGVEAAGQLAAALGERAVLAGTCKIISKVEAPAHVNHFAVDPIISLGETDNRASERTTALVETLRRCRVRAEIPPDIHTVIWQKFLFISSLSGVGALTRDSVGTLRSRPVSRRMLQDAMGEVAAVAAARGVALPAGVVADTMAFVDSLPAESSASMQRDIMEGRPSELEAQNGAVVRLGAAAGVETPVHSRLYRELLPLERAARGGGRRRGI